MVTKLEMKSRLYSSIVGDGRRGSGEDTGVSRKSVNAWLNIQFRSRI
jgi:hypothetical protein